MSPHLFDVSKCELINGVGSWALQPPLNLNNPDETSPGSAKNKTDKIQQAWIEDFEMGGECWPGRRQRQFAKAWKRGVLGLHAGQCVCGFRMNNWLVEPVIAYSHSPPQSEKSKKSNIISIFKGYEKKKRKKEGGLRKRGRGWKFTHFTSPESAPAQIVQLENSVPEPVAYWTALMNRWSICKFKLRWIIIIKSSRCPG